MRSRSGWTRTSSLLAWLTCAAAAWAQEARPLPSSSPPGLVVTGHRVHVEAHEDLDPDRLRALARPGVILWLRTRSNTLRESTLEHLGRFDEAFVQVRPPLTAGDARALTRHPRVGAWIDEAAWPPAQGRPARVALLAVEVAGVWDEPRSARVQALRPQLVRWSPAAAPDVMAWGLFRQTPGRRVVALPTQALLATRCARRSHDEPALEIDAATLLALSSDVFPCGAGVRVVLRPDFDLSLLQGWLVREPSLELVLRPGLDDAAAGQTARFLDALGLPRR